MELTQAEKDRILAEEQYRLEAKRQVTQPSGCCGHGVHRGGFWRGFVLGIILCALIGLVCHHHCRRFGPGYGHGFGQQGQGCFMHQGWGQQNQDQNAQK